MKFGCHVSIRDGYLGAAQYATKIGAKAYQYFPKNPRSLSIKDFDRSDAKECKNYCQDKQLVSISHSPYPTSLVPTTDKKKKQVVESLLNDLHISDSCGSIGVVVHFGKHIDAQDPLASYQIMIQTLNTVLGQWNGDCKILLENNAGKPGTIGTTLEELVQVRKLSNYPEKIGFCFDTCHAFASGLWNGNNWQGVVHNGEALGYFDHLQAIHLNNSKYPTASGKDRHANIFHHGHISKEQWQDLMEYFMVKKIPMIMETPNHQEITHQRELAELHKTWPEG
ncbi:deoxyribonuclease IV [Aquibacillus sediminis]|uniref:deoxyribonuclease IV n=1 Tax=Aquibacillus sediminis TaxID=2574734 RepID=UPI0011083831|nr:deoxyribonuclease IV [Aquibacillus sediminis]